MIVSTGTSTIKEIEETVSIAKKYGSKDLTLLYCVSTYPAKKQDFNLNNIKILKEKFNCRVGLSYHSLDDNIVISSIAAGAEIIEKHIALGGQKKGLDIKFSLKGKQIKKFKHLIDSTYQLMGKKEFYRSKNEQKNKIFRRSIFVVKNIIKGERFNKTNIKRIRPGNGLEPKLYEKILGKKSKENIITGTPLRLKHISSL